MESLSVCLWWLNFPLLGCAEGSFLLERYSTCFAVAGVAEYKKNINSKSQMTLFVSLCVIGLIRDFDIIQGEVLNLVF